MRTVSFFFICSRDCCQLWASELELFFFFFFFLRLSWFLNNSQWLNEAGKWSRRDGAECFFISEWLFWNKSGGEGWGEQKAGEEINGLAKEWVSYTGIRWDKPRTCRLGGGVKYGVHFKRGMTRYCFLAFIPEDTLLPPPPTSFRGLPLLVVPGEPQGFDWHGSERGGWWERG